MFAAIVAGVTTLLTFAGLGYFVVALWSARAFLRRRPLSAEGFAPPVSVLKPLRGVDAGMAEAFASHCRQSYTGEYEILFGVASLSDPAVEMVRELQAAFPERSIRLILCADVVGPNGKVSCVAQLAPQARYDYLIVNDSDIRVGAHYLAHVMAPFAGPAEPPVGLVTALYRGRSHGTLGSKLETLGISTEFGPSVLTSRYLERGLHFALGSTLAVSRTALEAIGGFEPLAAYLADDYELGARVAAAGFRVELSREIVETSVPPWDLRGFFQHQLRWARTVRDSRPWGYAGLFASYGLAWAMLNLVASGFSLPSLALLSLALLFRVTLALSVGVGVLGDRGVLRDLWLLPLRDLLALGLWAWSYASHTVVWRNERFLLKKGKLEPDRPEAEAGARAPAR